MPNCTRCGAQINAGFAFCPVCGAPAAPKPPEAQTDRSAASLPQSESPALPAQSNPGPSPVKRSKSWIWAICVAGAALIACVLLYLNPFSGSKSGGASSSVGSVPFDADRPRAERTLDSFLLQYVELCKQYGDDRWQGESEQAFLDRIKSEQVDYDDKCDGTKYHGLNTECQLELSPAKGGYAALLYLAFDAESDAENYMLITEKYQKAVNKIFSDSSRNYAESCAGSNYKLLAVGRNTLYCRVGKTVVGVLSQDPALLDEILKFFGY